MTFTEFSEMCRSKYIEKFSRTLNHEGKIRKIDEPSVQRQLKAHKDALEKQPGLNFWHEICGFLMCPIMMAKIGKINMTDEQENWIDGENPLASLTHDQKIQLTTARYLRDIRPYRGNATEVIRTSEFDIPKRDVNKNAYEK